MTAGGASDELKPLWKQANEIDSVLILLKDTVITKGPQKQAGEDGIHFLSHLHDWFGGLMYAVAEDYDTAPGQAALGQKKELEAELNNYIDAFNNLVKLKITEFNKEASSKGLPILLAGQAISIQ